MTDYSMDGGQWDALKAAVGEGHEGEDFALACNVVGSDHVHARRVGAAGAGLASRAVIASHTERASVTIFLAAPEARMLAAALLNIADEIEGVTPLAFFPPQPEPETYPPLAAVPDLPEEDEDPGVTVEEAEALIGHDLAILGGGPDTERPYHRYVVGTVVRVLSLSPERDIDGMPLYYVEEGSSRQFVRWADLSYPE